MKNKSFEESEVKKYEAILNTEDIDSFTYKLNRLLYEISVDIYNLTQQMMKRKMYCRSKEEEQVKKIRKVN